MGRILVALALCCPSVTAIAAPAYKGMSLTSFNPTDLTSATTQQSIANMKTLGVDTVALNFWWYQSSVTANTMAAAANSSTIASVQSAIDTIHGLGMKVLLKPMLDVSDGTWRAYINPTQPDTWFGYDATNPFTGANTAPLVGSFGNFIDTFADIAQAKGVEMLSIGCEMNNMENASNSTRWTNLIDNVRTHYSGPLTYSANWSTAGAPPGGGASVAGGYNNVTFWNQLDEIGIDAYFPVANTTNPTIAQLQNGWINTANTIENWRSSASLTGKRVIFSETGYASYDGTAESPYASAGNQAVDEQEQSDAYTALLSVMDNRSWWDGAFWWNWETSPNSDAANSYSPQNKLVQDVLASNYGGTVPALSASSWNSNSSGTFSTAGNWNSGVPNQNFVAAFNRGAGVTFTVSLSNNRTFDQLRVGSNVVTFQSNSTTTSRTMTADDWHTGFANRGMIIGVSNGDTGVVNSNVNGSASVTISTRAVTLGEAAGAAGTLNLNGGTFNVTGSDTSLSELIVGRFGTGTLLVQNGAKLVVNGASGDAEIGEQVGSTGTATVTGAGSSWTTTGTIRVGRNGAGTLNVLSGGTVTASTFLVGAMGNLQGDGTVIGAVQNGGIVAPGNSAGALHVTGTYTQTSIGQLQIEIAGTTPGTQYDQLLVTGAIVLDGTLQVTLNNFSPTVGNSFNIIDSGTAPLTTFATVNLPALGSFLAWDHSQLYSVGVLSVISTLPGDYNRDGIVDAADYTVWRDTLGQTVAAGTGADSDGNGMIDQADYDNWVLDFGTTVGSLPGAGAAAAVPEPQTFRLAIFAIGLFFLRSRFSSRPRQ
jgi:T5SS/PEP-CTERM-associated repeat protein